MKGALASVVGKKSKEGKKGSSKGEDPAVTFLESVPKVWG